VGEEKREFGGSARHKAREDKKINTQKGKQQQSKNRKYNSKESTYFGKGMATTKRFCATG
jgi:hypothetical protein